MTTQCHRSQPIEAAKKMEQLRITPQMGNDEIDLFDLVRSIWEQKIALALTAFLTTLLAGAYAFFATPHYQVQSVLRPAQLKDLDAINIPELYSITPEEALKKFGATLDSYDARFNFFRENQALFEAIVKPGHTPEQSFERFNSDAFRILKPDPKRDQSVNGFVGVELTYPKGLDGTAVVNGLVEHAVRLQRKAIATDIEVLIQNRLDQLDRRISAARIAYQSNKNSEIARLKEADILKKALLEDELTALRKELSTRRQARIAELNEAIKIAKALGITKPTTPSALGELARPGQGSVILTEVHNRQIPLYFMGTETLEAEQNALQQRTTDDFTEPRISQIVKELKLLEHNRQIEVLQQREQEDLFLNQIANWEEKKALLEGLKPDLSATSLIEIDRSAVAPLKPVKPRKALILALGLVLGGMLGVLVALLLAAIKKQTAASKASG